MKASTHHTTLFGRWLWKAGTFSIALLLLSFMATAQNTKGDKPVSNQKQVRESKFKIRTQKKKPRTKDLAGRRLRTKDKSSANRANASYRQPDPYVNRKSKSEQAAKPRGRVFSAPPREQRQPAWRGDISGAPLRKVRPAKSDAARNYVVNPRHQRYIQHLQKVDQKPKIYTRTASGSYPVRLVPSNQQRAWKGDMKGNPVSRPRSASGRTKNVYKHFGKYENNPSRKPKSTERLHYGKSGQAPFINFSSPPKPSGRRVGAPASASRPYVKRGRKNVYWGKYSRGEKANTRDIAGGPLRTRNFRSTPAGLVGRDTLKNFGKKPLGEQSPKTKRKPGGGFITTRKGQRAWTGDISGSKIRRTRPQTKETAGKLLYPRQLSISRSGEAGRQLPGGGFTTRTRKGRVERNPLPPRAPGIGGSSVDKYNSSIKGRKPVKGGGSVDRGGWNNKGVPVNVRIGGEGSARAANYQGSFKRGEMVPGFNTEGIGFAGNFKTRRPAKGGGSVSGKLWNNRENPVTVRRGGDGSLRAATYQGNFKRGQLVPGFSDQGADYAGNIKTRRPAKGGGSVSGKLWNNNNEPVDVNDAGKGTVRASKYQGNFKRGDLVPEFNVEGIGFAGNIKTKRPAKGGGSVSGKLWNNNNEPVDVNDAGKGTVRASKYQGSFKRGELVPEFNLEGIEHAGNIKTKRPAKGGGSVSGKLWNNNERPVQGEDPTLKDAKMARYTYKEKKPFLKKMYVQNPNASKESILKSAPDETTYRVGGLQVRVHEKNYKEKPYGAKGSLPGIAPKAGSLKATEYARAMKRTWDYKHNPNSAKEALDIREPGKANARIGDFQGNVKMQKARGPEFHPDAKFAHGEDSNVEGERSLMTNVKLLWAKLFKKSDSQPDHLKEKNRRPRYDKREQGMWND